MEPGGLDWTTDDAPVYMRYEPGTEPDESIFLPCIRRGENEGPFLTPEEEKRRMTEQADDSQGFDINFKEFRCVFNYIPVDFDINDFVEPDTTREVIDMFSRTSLEGYNKKAGTKYEFVKVIKANLYPPGTAAVMFYITFQAKDPCDDEPKDFRAKVCYMYYASHKYHSCDLKPQKKVHSIETAEKEGVKKPRLTQEQSTI